MLANIVAAVVFVATFAALCRAYTLIRNIRAAMWESEDMAARKAMRLEGITAPYVGRRK